jgi:hypothetical protein
MQREAYLASMLGNAPCSKKIGGGPIKWLLKGKKKVVRAPLHPVIEA